MSLISPPPTFSYVWLSWACLVMQTCSRTFLLKWRQLRRNHSLTNLCCCFSSHILNFFCPKDDHLFSKEQSHQRYQVIPIRILTGNLMDTLTDRKTRKRGFLLILILQKISQIQIWHFLFSLCWQTDRQTRLPADRLQIISATEGTSSRCILDRSRILSIWRQRRSLAMKPSL